MIRRVIVAVAIAAVACGVAQPGVVHADAAGPTDYRTDIVAVTPEVAGLVVTIEGGDSFVRLQAPGGSELLVLGYAGEPYLRFEPDGTVSRNLRSAATYENEQRYGGVDLPEIVDATASPQWEIVGSDASWAWHDHRAHWMGAEPPVGLDPGDSLPVQAIPLVVDGTEVSIDVRTTLVEGPSGFPAAVGLFAGLVLALVGLWLGPATATLATLIVAIAATIVGVGQYLSLPSETGPLWSWWALPAVAVAAAVAAIATYGRSPLLLRGLLALSGVQLAIWALLRRDGLMRPVLPTDLPFWFDRMVTAGALVTGVVMTVFAVSSLAMISSSTPRRSPR